MCVAARNQIIVFNMKIGSQGVCKCQKRAHKHMHEKKVRLRWNAKCLAMFGLEKSMHTVFPYKHKIM